MIASHIERRYVRGFGLFEEPGRHKGSAARGASSSPSPDSPFTMQADPEPSKSRKGPVGTVHYRSRNVARRGWQLWARSRIWMMAA